MATLSGTSDISGIIIHETVEIPVSERHVVRKLNRRFLVIGVVLFMQENLVQKGKRQQEHCRSAYQFISVSLLVPYQQVEKEMQVSVFSK